jgi:hypothetical protein
VALLSSRPDLFGCWAWLAIFIEERALFLARCYRADARRRPGAIDALHAQVQAFHLRDEARHVCLDRHLLEALYDPQPAWKKAFASRLLAPSLRSYVAAARHRSRSWSSSRVNSRRKRPRSPRSGASFRALPPMRAIASASSAATLSLFFFFFPRFSLFPFFPAPLLFH